MTSENQTSTPDQTPSNPDQERAINLHVSGYGWLNKCQYIEPNRGPKYMVANFALQEGVVKGKDYSQLNTTFVDCTVPSKIARSILDDHVIPVADDSNKKPLIKAAVVTGGLQIVPFTYNSGEKEGQTGFRLKSRLIRINALYVDGKEIDLSSYYPENNDDDIPF